MASTESLTPRDLVNKHLHDEKHVVTDEELRALKVGDSAEDEEKINEKAETRKDEIQRHQGNDTLPNPYTVL